MINHHPWNRARAWGYGCVRVRVRLSLRALGRPSGCLVQPLGLVRARANVSYIQAFRSSAGGSN